MSADEQTDSRDRSPDSRESLFSGNIPIEKFRDNRTCLSTLEPLAEPALYSDRAGRRLFGERVQPVLDFTTADFERLAEIQINRRMAVTGVQRKISLGLAKNRQASSRLTFLEHTGTHILQPPIEMVPEMPQVEHTTMRLAESVGFQVPPCGLIPLKNGDLAFIIRRFDREKKKKIPVEDLCQLSGKPTEQKYKASLEATANVIRKYSGVPGDDLLTFFELNLFCFITGNADMHLKNFSIWKDPRSDLSRLAPVYDLLSTRLLMSEKEDPEETALSLNGKKANLKLDDFKAFARNLEIPGNVFERVRREYTDRQKSFEDLIEKSFLSERKKEGFKALIRERLSRLKDG